MAETLSVSKLQAAINLSFNNNDPLVPLTPSPNISLGFGLAQGTGAGQVNLIYAKQLTIAAGGNVQLDLSGGTLTDPLGNVLVFSVINTILILLQPGTPQASAIKMQPAATNGFSGPLTGTTPAAEVGNGPKGGIGLWTRCDGTGWPVNASTAHVLQITNEDGTNAATVQVVLLGH